MYKGIRNILREIGDGESVLDNVSTLSFFFFFIYYLKSKRPIWSVSKYIFLFLYVCINL